MGFADKYRDTIFCALKVDRLAPLSDKWRLISRQRHSKSLNYWPLLDFFRKVTIWKWSYSKRTCSKLFIGTEKGQKRVRVREGKWAELPNLSEIQIRGFTHYRAPLAFSSRDSQKAICLSEGACIHKGQLKHRLPPAAWFMHGCTRFPRSGKWPTSTKGQLSPWCINMLGTPDLR